MSPEFEVVNFMEFTKKLKVKMWYETGCQINGMLSQKMVSKKKRKECIVLSFKKMKELFFKLGILR